MEETAQPAAAGVAMNKPEKLPNRRLRLAADIGGTFTDVAAFDERTSRLLLGKTLSTPRHLVEGISEGAGKSGARFADASIFPTMPSGNTNAPSIMVGEKAAEIIKAAA